MTTHGGIVQLNCAPNFGGQVPYHLLLNRLYGGAMSWQAVTWVLEQSEATLGSRLVILSIASHANREGKNAFPSMQTISREALLSEREVRYCVNSLEEAGEIRVTRGIGRGNPSHYELPHVERWLQKLQKGQSLPPSEKVKGAIKTTKGAIHDNKRGNDLEVKSNKSSTSDLQPLEPSKERTVIKKLLKPLCIPERSKPLSNEEIIAKRDEQIKALKEKGFL